MIALCTGATACAAILGVDDGEPRTDGGAPDTSVADSARADAGADAADAAPKSVCSTATAFGASTAFASLNTVGTSDSYPRLTPDELTIVFASDRAGSLGLDLYGATRPTRQSPFNSPATLGASVNTKFAESEPALSPDGLTLYFASARGLAPQWDIWASSRATAQDVFGAPINLAALNTPATDWSPYFTSAGSVLLFASTRNSSTSLLYASSFVDGGYGAPATLSGMTDAGVGHNDRDGALSKDGLVLYFASDRAGGQGGMDIWLATRADKNSPFGAPKPVTELNTPGDEYPGWISDDLCRVYFSTNKTPNNGDFDLFVSERAP